MDRAVADGLRASFGEEGIIRFSIRAKNTEQNAQIHAAFREFCKNETNDDYTLGLKVLLQYYQDDYKYATLRDLIMTLKMEIDELRAKIETAKPQDKDLEAF